MNFKTFEQHFIFLYQNKVFKITIREVLRLPIYLKGNEIIPSLTLRRSWHITDESATNRTRLKLVTIKTYRAATPRCTSKLLPNSAFS